MTADGASWLSCSRQTTRKHVPQLGQEVTEKNFMFSVSTVKANETFPSAINPTRLKKLRS